jgi:hypothetical protein
MNDELPSPCGSELTGPVRPAAWLHESGHLMLAESTTTDAAQLLHRGWAPLYDQAALDDLSQQLADEQRQHAITRGDLERTRLVRDEALRDLEQAHRSAYRDAIGRA